ncbi:PopZ family protein [Xanthobacter pseudotagetidis]|uniref:PopZ family protein n=1 Tax=Xanthobacter pseudotagetidis TaxID=3119911 RepID=UPI00372BFB72
MDEILASIRRIIADDELTSSQRRGAAEAALSPRRYDEEPPQRGADVRRWEPRAERRPAPARQEMRGGEGRGHEVRGQEMRGQEMRGQEMRSSEGRGPDPRGQEQPLADFDGLDALQELDAHLADLRASEERAAERRAEGRAPRPAPRGDGGEPRRYPSDPTPGFDDRREARGVARDADAERAARRTERREMRENLARPSAAEPAPQRPSLAAARAAGESEAPLPLGRRKDLLSPAADAAIASSLNALGDLVLPQRDRTVEDLVKEILRPMLKEWLDENLPHLVEQLVRAEIERVVRSGR